MPPKKEDSGINRKSNTKLKPAPQRGWLKLHTEHVQQAHLGADLDFL